MGLGSPSAALWGTIKSLIPPKPEQEPRSFFSCMGAGGGGNGLLCSCGHPGVEGGSYAQKGQPRRDGKTSRIGYEDVRGCSHA